MANDEHLSVLLQGSMIWNEWCRANPGRADLSGADLSGADLSQANLSGVDLRGAKLKGTRLTWADLSCADVSGADLTGADLGWTDLPEADLSAAELNEALFYETKLGNVFLKNTTGLDNCDHSGPSMVDFQTLLRSENNLPIAFLRGCGIPEILIEYMPSLRGEAIRFYSCFISYSSKDQTFADRLHADLQNSGVRCWFAPHDLPIGARILDAIDEAIRLREKAAADPLGGIDWE